MQDMVEVQSILQDVANSSGNSKQAILYKNGANRLLRDVLKFIYNPYFRTNISNRKLERAPIYKDYPVPENPKELMDYLVNHPTGDLETCGIAKTWIYRHPECEWLCTAIVTQSMQIGVNVTTLNKVFGSDFIPKISCMLGTPLDKVSYKDTKWPYIVTEKLDGIRRLLVKQNGTIKLYSRSGHEDTGLVDIIEEAKHLPDNYVYDGELLAVGTFKDSIAQRQATNSIANRKGERTGLTFNIFDMIPVNEFMTMRCTENSLVRKCLLAATLNDDSAAILYPNPDEYIFYQASRNDGFNHKLIKPVPVLALAHSMEDIDPIVEKLWAAGKEGVMLNRADAPYQSKRVKTLVKMKKTVTYVLRVEGFFEGNNKYEGMLGSLITEYKDCMLQVGSGFTDEERWEIWANQDKYDGALFEVEAFGESTNKQGLVSLNCPIFKRFISLESEKLFVE